MANCGARRLFPRPGLCKPRRSNSSAIVVIAIPATGRLTSSSATGSKRMSAGAPAVKRLFKWKLSPRKVSLLIVLFVFTCTFTVRHLGWLQFLEFQAYDFFIRYQPKAATSDPLVIVEMTETDIHSPSLDYPIYDDKLAELLSKLEADHPAVIGLDIWRDIPVPKRGHLLHEFNDVLLS